LKPKKSESKSEHIRLKLKGLIDNYGTLLEKDDLRNKVIGLIPAFKQLRGLGKSIIQQVDTASARDRILFYMQKYPLVPISGDEFLVISGIQEYARRIRELRVQFGWKIISGYTAREMAEAMEADDSDKQTLLLMKPSDYMLVSKACDRELAHRWNMANTIRNKPISIRDKIIEFLKLNVGRPVTGEELRYLAKNRLEWPRRVRELRTEFGWPIVTKNTGREDLDVGSYVLEADRQSPVHDRKIPDPVRYAILERDKYKCVKCGWSHKKYNRSNPRHLELHHVKHHSRGGENTKENLISVCTSCHDEIHRAEN